MLSSQLRPNGSASLLAGPTSSRVAMAGTGPILRISNGGSVPVFLSFGDSTVSATVAAGLLIQPGASEPFTEPSAGLTHFAAITETGNARVSVSRCDGDQ